MAKTKEKKRSRFLRALDVVERVGNALPHPATIFGILALLVAVASAIAAWAGRHLHSISSAIVSMLRVRCSAARCSDSVGAGCTSICSTLAAFGGGSSENTTSPRALVDLYIFSANSGPAYSIAESTRADIADDV